MPPVTQAPEPTTAFSAAQYDEAYPPGVERSFWHVARNAILTREVVRAGMARMPLLEIGCGRGIIVSHLRRHGIDCIGCDLASPNVPQEVQASVFTATDFRDLPLERRARIEGALLCDVLEHLSDPGELLREVVRALPALRRILVTVPARMELWSDWDVHFGHFRRYSMRSLREELVGAGLSVARARYFFHALYGPMLVARGRHRDTTISAPSAPGLHQLLGRVFALEGKVIPRWVPGTSIVAIAEVRVGIRSK
jgi:SAM-dependent methyltransferase